MNKKIMTAIALAFSNDITLQRQLKALGKGVTNSKTFQKKAGDAVAAAATRIYKAPIVCYDGQRGIAFGVQVGTKEDGTPKYERTKECDATRQWFRYNVGQKKKANAKSELKGVWAKIADGITALGAVARTLRKEDPAKGKQLAARVEALVSQYS